MIPEYRIDHLRRALGHRYQFEAFLGRGAFATVVLVRNLKLGRREALKVLQESYDGDHEFAKRFVDEARLVASLDHPNIVKVYDYGEVDGVLWYSMQYIGGPSLGAELEIRRPLTPGEVISAAVPLLDALGYSHGAGIVHRDVKPGNIMISERGRPYLMDFGIAKVKDSGFKTATGSVLGTPAYISPEQASSEDVDGRSDVYSFGVCLYQMLTGALPFPASDPIQMLLRRLKENPEPPSSLLPSVDPELEAIILKSLERAKEERFQSAAEMRERLLATFRNQVDAEAVKVTVAVQEPTPLKGVASSPQATAPSPQSPAGAYPAASEAPTQITRRGPALAPEASAASPPPRNRSGRLVAAALLVGALLAAAFFLLRPDGAKSPMAQQSTSPPAVEASPTDEAAEDGAEGVTAAAPSEASDQAGEPGSDDSSDTAGPAEPSGQIAAQEDLPPVTPPPPAQAQSPPRRHTAPTREPAPRQETAPRPRQAVVPPAILEAPTIELDEITAQQCSSKEVILSVSVDAEGELTSSRAIGRSDEDCRAAALEHVKSYRFKPGRDFEDLPVPAKMTLSIQFP